MFASSNICPHPTSVNLKVLKSVFQVSRVFVFFPKKLLKSPRTMDKIINDMLINLMSNFKPGWAPAQTKSMFDCQAFNWAVSVTAKMDSVTGSRNPQRYSLIQAFLTNLCRNEQW